MSFHAHSSHDPKIPPKYPSSLFLLLPSKPESSHYYYYYYIVIALAIVLDENIHTPFVTPRALGGLIAAHNSDG